jgi:hypothetical protein
MNTKNLFRIIIAVLVGEAALILFATVAQEVLFNGIRYNTSPVSEIILGGLATFVAAILAGITARLCKKRYHKVVPVAISIIITAEMTYLISTNKTGDPLWFDLMGGAALIVGVWTGYSYRKFIRGKEKLVDDTSVA